MQFFKKSLLVFVLGLSTIVFSACGKNDEENNNPVIVPTPTPYPGGGGQGDGGSCSTCGGGTYAPGCPNGGASVWNGSMWVCDSYILSGYFGGINVNPKGIFPRVTAYGQQNGFALHSPKQVFAGDKLIFVGSGSYGKDEEGFIWSCTSTDVDDIDLLGIQSNSTQTNAGFPAGLIAHTTDAVYLLGFNSNQRIVEDGMLLTGFNSDHTDACFQLTVSQYRIRHCTNSHGYTVNCP